MRASDEGSQEPIAALLEVAASLNPGTEWHERLSRRGDLEKLLSTLGQLDASARNLPNELQEPTVFPAVLRFLAYSAIEAVCDFLGPLGNATEDGPTYLLAMTCDALQSTERRKLHPMLARSEDEAARARLPDIRESHACAAAVLEYLTNDLGESEKHWQSQIASAMKDAGVRPPGENLDIKGAYGGDAIRKWRASYRKRGQPQQMTFDLVLLTARRQQYSANAAMDFFRTLIKVDD